MLQHPPSITKGLKAAAGGALTLSGEEGLVVEGLQQIQAQQVLEVTAAAAGLLPVQLRLDADWPLMARPAPRDLPARPSVALTLEKPELPGGVLHTLPLLEGRWRKVEVTENPPHTEVP